MRLLVSKARGLCPLAPQQRLSLCNPVLAVEERGLPAAFETPRWWCPSLRRPELGSKGSALGGVPRGRAPWPCLLTALITSLALTSCSPPPPPPPAVLTLNIVGSAGQNPGGSGAGNVVAVQVYQLAATGKFLSTDFYSLTGQEAATLGQDEMGASQQFLLAPGQTLTETEPLKPTVTAIGVAVLFRYINKSMWRLTAPVASSGPSVVTLRIIGLAATIDK